MYHFICPLFLLSLEYYAICRQPSSINTVMDQITAYVGKNVKSSQRKTLHSFFGPPGISKRWSPKALLKCIIRSNTNVFFPSLLSRERTSFSSRDSAPWQALNGPPLHSLALSHRVSRESISNKADSSIRLVPIHKIVLRN